MKNSYRLVLGIFLVMLSYVSMSQTFNSVLQVAGLDINTIEDVVVDPSGFYYIVGNSKAAITTPTNSATGSSTSRNLPYLAKLNASGSVVWMRYITSAVDNNGYNIKIDAAGNVFLLLNAASNSNYFANPFDPLGNLNATGSNKDGAIVKYNSSGVMQWAVAVGDQGTAIDELVDFNLDANGDVYAVGYVTSGTTTRVYGKNYGGAQTNYATITTSATTSLDAVVVKFSNAGAYQWGFSLGTAATAEKASAIAIDASNNIYVGGVFAGTVDFDPSASSNNLVESSPQGAGDGFIAKYSSAGAYIWSGGIAGNAQENIRSMHIGSSGSLYVIGEYSGAAVDFDITAGSTAKASNGIDIFFAKYDLSTKALGFVNTIGGSSTDLGKNIFATSSEVFVTGSFQGASINFNPNGTSKTLSSSGAEDIFYAKYSSAGINSWANAFGSTGTDIGTASYVSPLDGKLFLAGYSNSTTVGDFDNGAGTSSFTNLGLNDAFIAQYTECVAPTISTQPSNLTICGGSNGSLTVGTTGSGITYQWKKSGVNVTNGAGISGATTSSLTFTGISVANAGSYTCDVMSGCAATLTTNAVTVTVNAVPTITTQPSSATICAGSNASFTIAASGTAITYQWQKGGVNVTNGGVFSGATTATLQLTGATSANAGTYTCIVSGTCTPSATSNAATLTVNDLPAITTQPSGTTICSGSNTSLTVVATGSNLTYQWQKGGVNVTNGGVISGATTATLQFTGATTANTGSYTCIVSGTCTPSVTSNVVTVTVNALPVITTQPTNATVCSGSNTTFTIVATGSGLTYQWQKGGVNVTNGGVFSGATTATLTLTGATATDAGSYTCIVSGTCTPGVTSNAATLTVNALPAITTQPTGSIQCQGGTLSFSVIATGSGLTYQWYKGGVAMSNSGRISGATSANLSISPSNASDIASYYCIVSGTCTPAVTSNTVAAVITSAPTITSSPGNTTLCEGQNLAYSVTATGAGLTYQWFKGATALTDGGTISGATTANLTITGLATTDAGSYTCTVSGACAPTATSTAAIVTVNSLPKITVQASDVTICSGGNASFAITATGTGISYQWKKNGTNITNGGVYAGATTNTLSITAATTTEAAVYTCTVSGTCTPSVTSSNYNLIVNSVAAITTQPSNQTICEASNLNLTIGTSGAGVNYQWFKGATALTNGGTISGATSATLVITGISTSDAGNYTCQISNICTSTITSSVATITVNALPKITVQASDVTICAGANASFAITATGTGITYQWRKNGTNLTNTGVYSGVTTNTLSITAATTNETAVYTCVVSGTCTPSATTSNYNLTVNSVASIATQPVDQTICEGTNLNLSIVTNGAGVNYQWFKGATALTNGGSISGANSSDLVISGALLSDAGSYSCQISNICTSTITSSTAVVTINAKPVITTQPVGTTICSSANVNFSIVASGTGVTYQWKRNGTNLIDGGQIAGASTNTLTITGASGVDAGTYTCVVSGTCTPSVTSSGAALVVTTSSVITTQPSSVNVCTNTATSFSLAVSGSGVTYKWQKDGVDLTNGGTISGVSTATLSISSVSAANVGNYTCITGNTCSGTLVSNAATLSIIQSPIITSQPTSQSICTSAPVSFSVTATGSSLAYQWKKDGVVLSNNSNISGVNTSTLSLALATTSDAGNYTCVVSNSCQSIESNAAIFTVSSNLFIITQPFTSSVCTGNAIALDCEAIGGTVTYQWTKDGVDIVNGGRISGAQSTTLVITNSVLSDAADYQCKVISSCGSVLNSNTATITVNQNVSITTQPNSTTLCEGASFNLLADAIGSGISFKWKKDGVYLSDDVHISGSNTNSITVSNTTLADNGSYECVVTGVCGVKVTVPAAVDINPLTAITSQSQSQVVCTGNSINLFVNTVGSNNVYQWYKNGIALSNIGNVSGVSTNTLTITSYTSADAGDYTCDVTGDCGSAVLSAVINLSDATLPVITKQPVATNSCVSQNIVLIVGIQKPIGAIYQWKYNGTPLSNNATYSGVTNDTLTITNIALANAGNYTCDVSYSCTGATTSNVATVTVNNPGTITSQPIDVSVCLNQNATFRVIYSGTGMTFKWQFKPTNGVYADVVNGSVYSGATSSILVATNPDLTHQGLYRCLITEGCGLVTASDEASLHINVPQIVQQPVDVIGCVGQNVTISVVASGPNLTFQWYKDGVAINDNVVLYGTTTSDLLITNVTNADMGDYHCVITGICAPPATTTIAKLTTTVCTNTTNPFTKEKFFKVYPNPSQSTSNIEFTMGSGEEVKVKVYDLVGNALMEKETQMTQGNSVEINLENYAEGMYIIYVEKNGVIYTDKLEKIK